MDFGSFSKRYILILYDIIGRRIEVVLVEAHLMSTDSITSIYWPQLCCSKDPTTYWGSLSLGSYSSLVMCVRASVRA